MAEKKWHTLQRSLSVAVKQRLTYETFGNPTSLRLTHDLSPDIYQDLINQAKKVKETIKENANECVE